MLVMLCGIISAADYDFHVGGVYYSIIPSTTNLTVVSGDEKYTGDIVIPSGITVSNIEYTVTRIGHDSFSECPDLTSITFPSGINCKLEVIESNAFQNCKSITSLVIPNTVTLIDAYAFLGCSSLKRVNIGSGIKKIGNAAFNYCSSIERVDISDLSFWYDIDFVQYPGGYLATSNPLYYAKHLYLNGEEVTELNVPNELTQIKPRAFYNCEGLTSVYISNSSNVTSIGESAFYDCKNIASIKLNKELKEIKTSAFSGCKSIESLVIPDEVTLISSAAFSGCSSLKELTLGNALEVIETGFWGPAFGGTSVTEIVVPEKIKNLNGFWNSKLSIVNIGKTSLTEISGTGRDAILPIERINITDLATFMGIKKQLGGYDLYLNGNLVEDLTIPSSVSEIGERAMQGCQRLKNITIPSHVKTINDKAFNGCYYIETITFEGGSPTIGKDVFGTYNNTYIISKMREPSGAPNGIINECQRRNILCVPAGCKETYGTAEGWNTFRYIVEASGPEEAFLDRGNLYRIYGDEVTLVKGGAHAYWNYYLPEKATYQEKTYPITAIDCVVYEGYSPDIVIYAPIKSIAEKAFASCTGVNSVKSYIKEPFAINSNVFTEELKQSITLLVPYGTKAKYQVTDGWKEFASIKEMEPEPSEPYVVYNDGTLTFYCDNQRSSRQGVTYDLNEGSNPPEWQENKESITKAVFDASFTNARPTTTSYWFWDLSSLTKIEGMNYLNTSEVTDMYSMFDGCHSLTALDLSHFDTKNVTNMGQMFYGCNNLKSLNLSNFDTGNVTYMGFMFYLCYNLTSLDVSHFDTSKVTGMRMMFASCQNLTTLDISCFDVQSATDLSEMFAYCHGLTTLDVSKFNTENAETMGYMFKYCDNLTSLDLSSFSTRNAKDRNHETWTNYGIEGMLSGCNNLAKIAFGSGFASDDKLSCNSVFSGCDALSNVTYTGDIPTSINSTFFIGVGTANAPATLVVPEQYKANYQAKFSGNQFYSGYFTMSNGEASGLKDGDTFTVKTVEGVEMTFKVISAADKTCQLGDGTKACIDTSTSGSFTIPAEVNGFRVNSVASWALYGCYGLNEIVISEGVESLMDNSIEQCNGVTSFVLPASVTSLSNTFGGVSSCLKSIKVAEGNPVYDSRNNCNAIIETASNVLRDGCVNTVIPSTVTAIGDWAMCNKNLTSISIPSSVKSIGDGALRYNPFKTVTIPESIENVGFCAFEECWYLEKVTIASKKCRLEGAAFANCGMLKTVVSYLENPEAVYRNIFYNSYDGATSEDILNDNVELYVPFGTKTIYENTNGWKNFKNIVEMNATVGDVTGDGEVTKEDITEVEAEIINPSEEYDPNKDVNHDGVVNVVDIVEEVNIINSGEGTGSGYFWMGNYFPNSNNFPTINGKEVEGIVTTYTSLDDAMAKASRTYSAGEYAIVMYPSSWGTKDDLVFLDSENKKYYATKQKKLSDFPDYLYYESTEKIGDNTTITLSTVVAAKATGATLSSPKIQ